MKIQKYRPYLLFGLMAFGAVAAKAQNKYIPVSGGMEYKIVNDVEGKTANQGDHVELHLVTKVDDSVIFSTRDAMQGAPAPLQINRSQSKVDLINVLTKLSAGDSAVVRTPIDSVIKSGIPKAPWMKEGQGQMLFYTIKMVSVKTNEQKQKEMVEHASKQKEVDDKLIQDYLTKNKIKAEKTESGMYYSVERKGDGAKPTAGNKVSVNYTGMLLDGQKFDSNVDPAFQHVQPFEFMLGQGQVIKGWDEGVALLNKGTKATFYIPSGLAYGERSPSPKIPANSVLVFEVELMGIDNMEGN